MALDAKLLRESLELVLERAPDLTARFYRVLFERYPDAQALFSRNSMRRQEEMLARALVSVVDHVEDAAWLREQLPALGAKHVSYGVRPEMYGWVGEALLLTLSQVAGADWTPELEDEWLAAYGVIVSLMRSGEAGASDDAAAGVTEAAPCSASPDSA